MATVFKLAVVTSVLTAHAIIANAQPGAEPSTAAPDAENVDAELRPPSSVAASPSAATPPPRRPLATTRRWGGGVRVTGLSGIGALPGVNFGGEFAGQLRRDEYFAELAFGWWKPEHTYVVTETPERVELGLDVWTLRAGWSSMKTPLRGWALYEVGEFASARGMPGVVTRMMTGEVPQDRRWQAVGAGFGVAWPMNDYARLVGMIEVAVPVNRGTVMLDQGAPYEPDALTARSSVGLELGWR